MLSKLSFLFTALLIGAVLSAQPSALEANQGDYRPLASPMDLFGQPQQTLNYWGNEALPLSAYSEQELSIQQQLNAKEAAIRTYEPVATAEEWTEIDHEDITPYTWKWVYLELQQADGAISEVQLRRPNWWLLQAGATEIGNQVYLSMPEMGIEGMATVTALLPNQLDTRIWDEKRMGDYVHRPITGKFIHQASDVYQLYFEGQAKPLGVTDNHPIYSIDREGFVAAGDLQLGERVKTQEGEITLVSKEKVEGRHRVYNLEVYRDHNFLVSTDKILVHNSCLPKISVVADDWVTKGAHIHFGKTELAVRPDGKGGIVFQKVFSSTSDAEFNAAVKLAEEAFKNGKWVNKFRHSVKEARGYMHGVQGKLSELANGRTAELNFLLKALE